MFKTSRFYRYLALCSYLGLLLWVPVWHFVLSQSIEKSPLFIVLLWIVPLLLPMKGIIQGSPYTHAWANFIVLIYLMHASTALYAVEGEFWYALIELALSVSMFVGCSFYARLRGKELGLKMRKLKDVMEEEKARFEGE